MTERFTKTVRYGRSELPSPGGPSAQACSPRPSTEGEWWTTDALLELRRARYRPEAWRRFIEGSLRRAAETRRARPGLARQARVWSLVGAAAWLVVCRAADRRRDISLRRSAGLLWWGSVWKMLDWHLGMAEGGNGKPRERLSAADAVTLTRFWLVPLLPAMPATAFGVGCANSVGLETGRFAA
jgi:hypothetical protein